jgi:hypothetical protein
MSVIGDKLRQFAAIADEHEEFTVVVALLGVSGEVSCMLHATMKDHHMAAASLADDLSRLAKIHRKAALTKANEAI